MQSDDATIATAIDWHLRQESMDEADWNRFTLWLEQDAAHARAYDRVALDDRLIGTIAFPAPAVAAPRPSPRPLRRWAWPAVGTAIAASLVALLLPIAMPRAGGVYAIGTKAGERRAVTLADGTQIEMNGGTRLLLDRADTRMARLTTGEATFHVVHDAAAPFTLRSGALTIRDLGTVFNVVRDGAALGVQVASGSVMVQPDADALVLRPGDAVLVREDRHSLTRAHVAPESVGGWRSGHLAFAGEPVGGVFAAVERRYGTRVTLGADLSARPFTGMVTLSGSADRDIPHLAALVGAKSRRDGEQWIVAPQP